MDVEDAAQALRELGWTIIESADGIAEGNLPERVAEILEGAASEIRGTADGE